MLLVMFIVGLRDCAYSVTTSLDDLFFKKMESDMRLAAPSNVGTTMPTELGALVFFSNTPAVLPSASSTLEGARGKRMPLR